MTYWEHAMIKSVPGKLKLCFNFQTLLLYCSCKKEEGMESSLFL